MRLFKTIFPFFTASILFTTNLGAQQPTDTLIRIGDLTQVAEQRYHLLQSKRFEKDAAASRVAVTSYSKLPSIDATYQAGFGTANNIAGMFYPTGLLPITGPASTGNNFSPATGSAASVLLNWQAGTFGHREAEINLSVAEATAQSASYNQAVFTHSVNVISKYLDVILARDIVGIQLNNIERVSANLEQSRVLSRNGIKAGVDTALFLSELSKARVEWLNAKKIFQTQQLLLGQMIVTDKLPVPIDSNFLERLPGERINIDSSFSTHPTIVYAQSQISLSNSRESVLKKSYLPKLNVWGTAFARGSGFLNDGSVKTWDGLGMTRLNYGAGVQLAFPIMKYGEVKRQLHQQSLLTKAAEENLQENISALSTQQRIAATVFQSSTSISKEAIQQRKSALYAFNAMQIRYNTGLVNFVELIQVQYNLLKAELDVKQAYWDTWKALLLKAAVQGDLSNFLNETR